MKARLFTMAAFGAILFAGMSTTAQAAQKLVGNTVIAPRAAEPISTNAGGVGIYISSTTIGTSTPGVPCYGANTGCSPYGSIAIPYPLVAVAGGTSYVLTVQLQSTNYTGYPTVNITLTQGGEEIATGSVTFPSAFGPGYVGYAYFTGTLPSTPGVVTVSSTLTSLGGQQLAPGGMKFSIY